MKQIAVFLSAVLAAATGVAAAAAAETSARVAWTPAKAERLVRSEATIRLAVEDAPALEAELRRALTIVRILEAEASLGGVAGASLGSYQALAVQYSQALRKLRNGLAVAAARCGGSGRAVTRGRFGRFRCSVETESLRIPSTAFEATDSGEIIPVGESRDIGPVHAVLDVRVTGRSTFVFRTL